MRYFLTILLAVVACQGCYATHINTTATPEPEELSHRQAFALWGTVALSDPTGGQCPNGLASAHSSLSPLDILIDAGVGIVAAGIVLGTCKDDAATCSSRSASAGTLATGLFGTRTVTFHCAAGPLIAPPPVTTPAAAK